MNNTTENSAQATPDSRPVPSGADSKAIESLNQYLKENAGTREGRAIPPLENWHPEQIDEMDLTIKANGEWWHEGGRITRQSLVSLFATILWKEEVAGDTQYYLKTPVQKLRIQVEDAPLLINEVGIVEEAGERWLEFTTTTGDVVRLDEAHPIELRTYKDADTADAKVTGEPQVRPYMLVRNGLMGLIGRNAFYHLTEIGELTDKEGQTVLTLQSGGQSYDVLMPPS